MSASIEPLAQPGLGAEPVATAKSSKPEAEPVVSSDRVASVDVLRGFALLGILAANITFFALPSPTLDNPIHDEDFRVENRIVWVVEHLFVEGKMMTIFSMIFGAGLVLMSERADARGRSLVRVYYRRVFWLLIIGLIHAYLIWSGDILVIYAECGLLLYPFRRISARILIVLGLVAILIIVAIQFAVVTGLEFLAHTADRAASIRANSEKPPKFDAWIHEVWTVHALPALEPSAEKRTEEQDKSINNYRGSYGGIITNSAMDLLAAQTIGFPLCMVWWVGGRMLLGMGLMKLGIFSASRSWRCYILLAAFGYGIGLPLVVYDSYELIRHRFHYMDVIRSILFLNYLASVAVALGHVGLLMMICKSTILQKFKSRLAAVGRMALTNYLMQSLICTSLFYGYGFGLYDRFDRIELGGIVLAIWLVQLRISPFWLARFRFGPAEWVWRSLTYWRLQSLRHREESGMTPSGASNGL